MATEIERKFLVRSDAYRAEACDARRICQGYLSSDPCRTVRVRIVGEEAFFTVKGASSAAGMSRFEWEHAISPAEAEALLLLCEPGRIEKTRYRVQEGDHCFEVDEFHGENSGLVVAEVELKSETELFERPDWLGEEVTGDSRYYNLALTKHPYSQWK